MKYLRYLGLFLVCASLQVHAEDRKVDTKDAAIGAGVGGAIGAVVGSELGDRNGAIVGSAIGAAVGTAIATDGAKAEVVSVDVVVETPIPKTKGKGTVCPPGQAKKGRC